MRETQPISFGACEQCSRARENTGCAFAEHGMAGNRYFTRHVQDAQKPPGFKMITPSTKAQPLVCSMGLKAPLVPLGRGIFETPSRDAPHFEMKAHFRTTPPLHAESIELPPHIPVINWSRFLTALSQSFSAQLHRPLVCLFRTPLAPERYLPPATKTSWRIGISSARCWTPSALVQTRGSVASSSKSRTQSPGFFPEAW